MTFNEEFITVDKVVAGADADALSILIMYKFRFFPIFLPYFQFLCKLDNLTM